MRGGIIFSIRAKDLSTYLLWRISRDRITGCLWIGQASTCNSGCITPNARMM